MRTLLAAQTAYVVLRLCWPGRACSLGWLHPLIVLRLQGAWCTGAHRIPRGPYRMSHYYGIPRAAVAAAWPPLLSRGACGPRGSTRCMTMPPCAGSNKLIGTRSRELKRKLASCCATSGATSGATCNRGY